jgi:hypothetical protein
MTDIRDLFDEAVTGLRPSRLSADEIYQAGRDRWRRRWTAAAGAFVSVGVAVVLVGVVATSGGSNTVAPPTLPPGTVRWAGLADAEHLYVAVNECGRGTVADPSRPPTIGSETCSELLASTDGGTTWQSRGTLPASTFPLWGGEVRGPQTLTMPTNPLVRRSPPDDTSQQISVDGGTTWAPLRSGTQAIETVPDGGWLVYGYLLDVDGQNLTGSQVMAVDPASHQARPLRVQPDLRRPTPQKTTGGLWVSGLDPATRRPAIAVSHDSGRSWTVTLLPGTTAVSTFAEQVVGAPTPAVASWDGTAAYATWTQPGPDSTNDTDGSPPTRVYRTTDGGTSWQAVDATNRAGSASMGWVCADGRFVLVVDRTAVGDGRLVTQYLVTTDGQSYDAIVPPGLPDTAQADGRIAYTDHAAYTSVDGWTWREVWHD